MLPYSSQHDPRSKSGHAFEVMKEHGCAEGNGCVVFDPLPPAHPCSFSLSFCQDTRGRGMPIADVFLQVYSSEMPTREKVIFDKAFGH